MDRQEREKKKEYLRQYIVHVRRVHRLTEEIAELRELKMSASSGANDGMPRGSDQSDLSGYAAQIDSMIRKLKNERGERIMMFQDITRRIKTLENKNEDDVLFYRYIKGMTFWEIAEKMMFSERQIHRIHSKALEHLRIPDEDGDESN